MDRFAFVRAEEERAKLIDHIGGCERILKTPLPAAYSIEIRQFIFVFLVALPFGILAKVDWLTPLVTMLVAFPILALDEIGVELQNPFSTASSTICRWIRSARPGAQPDGAFADSETPRHDSIVQEGPSRRARNLQEEPPGPTGPPVRTGRSRLRGDLLGSAIGARSNS